jgi:hypothetical protein
MFSYSGRTGVLVFSCDYPDGCEHRVSVAGPPMQQALDAMSNLGWRHLDDAALAGGWDVCSLHRYVSVVADHVAAATADG